MIRRLAAALRRVAIDVEPLRRSPDFRRIWLGLTVSQLGYQFTLVAVFVQVFDLTGSAAAVGATGAVGFATLMLGAVGVGTIIDRFDRRRLLIVAQFGFMAAVGILLVGSRIDAPPIAMIYGPVALIALLSAIDGPTRSAMTPRLVGREGLTSALALNQISWNTTALLGPALAGLVIGRWGVTPAYAIDLASYGAVLWAATRLPTLRPEGTDAVTRGGIDAVREGFRFLRGRRVLQSTFIVDLFAMVFGMPRALFPILAGTQFGGGAETAGLLFSAPAVGAVIGAVTAGWVARIERQGAAVLWAVVVWGAGITAFGLVGDRLVLALVLLALAGAADVVSAMLRTSILQLSVPDALRGRLSAIHFLVVTGGPRLGDLEAGAVATLVSPAFSVVSGGVLCMLGTVALAALVPSFRRYRREQSTA